MVFAKTNKRQTMSLDKNSKLIKVLIFLGLFILVESLTIVFLSFNQHTDDGLPQDTTSEIDNQVVEEPTEPVETKIILPGKIDFQPTVDTWISQVGGSKSVLIYDVERDEIVAASNPDEQYQTASLYKLFVVYEGYLRVQSGEWSAEAPCGATGRTILDCLDLSIRESNSACAETLWSMIGRTELEAIIKDKFGITNSDISHLISNPSDILAMMKIYYKHTELTDEVLVSRMKDSFFNQPNTIYNWRQGFPSGFSRANVYNKVGWDFNPDGNYWNIYNEAAVVEFPEEDRHYIVVVMSQRVPFQKIRQLGTEIENTFYNNYSLVGTEEL